MHYSIVGLLALILNIILNTRSIKNVCFGTRKQNTMSQASLCYGQFLLTTNCYYVTDILWGLLYERRNLPYIFPILYIDTIFYFIFMLMTMLTWARYILAYLDKKGQRSKLMLKATSAMFLFGLINLILNRFYHFIFYFNEVNDYVPGPGRYIYYVFQMIFYAATSIHLLVLAHNVYGRQKLKYRAVAMTSIVMGLFLVIQTLNSFSPFYAMGLIIGTCVVHSFVEAGEKKEKEIRDHIATVMIEDYAAVYYIDIETGEYLVFDRNQKQGQVAEPATGTDFYGMARAKVAESVHPEDKEFATAFYNKETMINKLEGKRSFSCKYRVMKNDEPRFFLITYMRADDERHIILYEKDIQDELTAEKKRKENQKKTVTFSQIAESLASNYDEIYYVDVESASYVGYEFNSSGQLQVSKSGQNFYKEFLAVIPLITHKQDRDKLINFVDKDNMISMLRDRKGCSIDYRIMIGDRHRYVRMLVRKSSDGSHFIIGVEDIDAEVKREREQIRALKAEKELARRDELTGVKNKTAYMELEASVQGNMDNGMDYLTFALVVCDANNLKQVNDTRGHVAGDEYIKSSAQLLCDIFVHSPVFRVGGDEFVVFLRGNDYDVRHALMKKLRDQIFENIKTGEGSILASGMAEYDSKCDVLVSEIFDRADKEMYENKQMLKTVKLSS